MSKTKINKKLITNNKSPINNDLITSYYNNKIGDNDYKNEKFNWCINTYYLDQDKDNEFSFINNHSHKDLIICPISKKLDEYRSWTWREIEMRKNGTSCGFIEVNKLIPKDMILDFFRVKNINDTILYKIEIKGKHRVWGVRTNNVLNLVWNDPNPKFHPISKKHT